MANELAQLQREMRTMYCTGEKNRKVNIYILYYTSGNPLTTGLVIKDLECPTEKGYHQYIVQYLCTYGH